MLKILNTKQIREADEFTIRNEPIASIDLMERACHAFVDWFVGFYFKENSILVVCGIGNNGGDGLGIARLLFNKGFKVQVSIIWSSKSQSQDFSENLSRLPKGIGIINIGVDDPIEFPKSDIVIDAIFGSGLSRPLEGLSEQVVTVLNELNSIRIAVDCPSGLLMDSVSDGVCLQAHHTVSFQIPKLSFLLPQSFSFVGYWHLVDIGLDEKFISNSDSQNYLIDEKGISKIIRARSKFNHKGDFGHCLIIAGSQGKIGANILATKAALRVGSGLVTSLTPACGYTSLQTGIPEAMVISDPDQNEITKLPDIDVFNAFGVGPGIGKSSKTAEVLESLFAKCKSGCVLDADALNLISSHPDLQKVIPANSILTPHPGEFRRLVGNSSNDFEKLKKQRTLSFNLKSIIILKGAHTSVALPNGEVFFNNTGNPAMATGGSGDVLTGVITGLLAQGYSPKEASILGVYIHGLAGDFAARDKSTIIASDIIEQIPHAMKRLETDR